MIPELPQAAGDSQKPTVSANAFDLLAPGVQQQLWRMKWTQLRPIQAEAIRIILQTESHCIISAETAGGKTEAAFLPILSNISSDPTGSVRAMYVGPLRALINDQFRRVEDLCKYLEMPVHRWHGDVGAASKSQLLKTPGGVLLITPESLESLFVNRSTQIGKLFNGLRFVVIDELHSFLDNERGLHLRSLLCRLKRLVADNGNLFRIAGLSATIGDLTAAQRYLDEQNPKQVHIITDESGTKELKLRLHGYRQESTKADRPETSEEDSDGIDSRELESFRNIATDLVEHCRGQANLVFANAKGDIEILADLCNDTATQAGYGQFFRVHHGSLAREIREDTEADMKSGQALTTICSSTLEMGIDIGSVRMVGQVGAPWSVASLKQRLGRSGRKDNEPRIMRMYICCREPRPDADIPERLHLELIRAIAITELMLEKWIEPPQPAACDLSTLTHQIISVIAETGGISARLLHDRLCNEGAFRSIEQADFIALLRNLGQEDIVEQTPEGDLILGLKGEHLRAKRDYYAAFQTPIEFSVRHNDRLIGTLPIDTIPDVDQHIVLAAHRWIVVSVDIERNEILVVPAKGRKRPLFTGSGGDLHERIHQMMLQVLCDSKEYAYLNNTAAALLKNARIVAKQAHIQRGALLPLSERRCLWFTWAGNRVQTTLHASLRSENITCVNRDVAIQIELKTDEARQMILKLAKALPAPAKVASFVQPKLRHKYDYLLSEELLDLQITRDVLDLPRTEVFLREYLNYDPS